MLLARALQLRAGQPLGRTTIAAHNRWRYARAGGNIFRPLSVAATGGVALASLSHASTATASCAPSPTTPLVPTSITDISSLELQMLGVSALTGYTAGFAVKRTFRVFVFTTGCIFVGLQSLAHNDLITVHWEKIEAKLNSLVDGNGDGKLGAADLQSTQERLQAYLAAGLPSAGSFSGVPPRLEHIVAIPSTRAQAHKRVRMFFLLLRSGLCSWAAIVSGGVSTRMRVVVT